MVKVVKEGWGKHKEELRAKLNAICFGGMSFYLSISYVDLVNIALQTIVEPELKEKLDYNNLHELDDGDYQGTLLYLIPFVGYQPSHYQYLMTTMWYGSCSGCDALQAAKTTEDLMNICETILNNLIKPYNFGWCHDEAFDVVNEEE